MSHRSIVCPFCPLHCDDWVAQQQDAANGSIADVHIDANRSGPGMRSDQSDPLGCEIAAVQFAAAIQPSRPRIGDRVYDVIDWNQFNDSFQLPAVPVVEFNAATIEESKGIMDLIRDQKMLLTWPTDPSAAAIDQTQSRDGMMAATLGDVCRQADFLWVIGDVESPTPRLKQRLDRIAAPMLCTAQLTTQTLARLHHLLSGFIAARKTKATESFIAMLAQNETADVLFQACLIHRSIAIVIGRDALERGSEIIASDMLQRWIRDWNDIALRIPQPPRPSDPNEHDEHLDPISRVVMLRFVADQSLRAVMRWRSNQLSGSGLSQPPPANVRVGCSNLPTQSPVQVQIGGGDPGESIARVYLPASTPGVHIAGTSVRGDGSVTMPLDAWLDGTHPSRLEALRRVLPGTVNLPAQ